MLSINELSKRIMVTLQFDGENISVTDCVFQEIYEKRRPDSKIRQFAALCWLQDPVSPYSKDGKYCLKAQYQADSVKTASFNHEVAIDVLKLQLRHGYHLSRKLCNPNSRAKGRGIGRCFPILILNGRLAILKE